MCIFFTSAHVMPGWICCRCQAYNGLQRTACKVCYEELHKIEIPQTVTQCESCGYGWEGAADWSHTLDGRDVKGKCPCCGAKIYTPGEASA